MAIRIKGRGGESVEQMMRRFKKLCEKEGLTKDVRRKEYYEKPSERRNRTRRRTFTSRPSTAGAGSSSGSGGSSGSSSGGGSRESSGGGYNSSR